MSLQPVEQQVSLLANRPGQYIGGRAEQALQILQRFPFFPKPTTLLKASTILPRPITLPRPTASLKAATPHNDNPNLAFPESSSLLGAFYHKQVLFEVEKIYKASVSNIMVDALFYTIL